MSHYLNGSCSRSTWQHFVYVEFNIRRKFLMRYSMAVQTFVIQ